MDKLHLDRLLLLTLTSWAVHTKLYPPHNSTEDVLLQPAPAPPATPIPDVVHLSDHPGSEIQHTVFDTLSFIIPILFALQQSPLVRAALMAMSSWEKLNRKFRAVKELRAMCAWVFRIVLSMLVMWYPVGGIKDVEEVWDSMMARKKRGGRVEGIALGDGVTDSSEAELGRMKETFLAFGQCTGAAPKEPICQRRNKMAGPGRLLVRKARDAEASFLSPVESDKRYLARGRGYGRAVMDVDLPVVCPPTV